MNKFQIVETQDLTNIEGGFVITGTMIVAGIGCLGGGVAVGYAAGKVIKHFL